MVEHSRLDGIQVTIIEKKHIPTLLKRNSYCLSLLEIMNLSDSRGDVGAGASRPKRFARNVPAKSAEDSHLQVGVEFFC